VGLAVRNFDGEKAEEEEEDLWPPLWTSLFSLNLSLLVLTFHSPPFPLIRLLYYTIYHQVLLAYSIRSGVL
jgi:hypothetical protein